MTEFRTQDPEFHPDGVEVILSSEFWVLTQFVLGPR
jgi:hypothetical protein